MKYLPVSWSQYHSLTQSLAAKILANKNKPDHIVAVARGGLTLGHLLSDLLQIPVSTITIQSYTDIQKQGELKITGKLHTPIKRKRVVLVDDVADSGKTLTRATAYLKRFHPAIVTTATLFYKPHSIVKPNHIAATTKKWILFPYEPTEMILLVTKQMEKEGKTKSQIQTFLERLHYSDSQIAFVRKHHLK